MTDATATRLTSERIEVEGDYDELLDLLEVRGWSDGLPVVPPTAERVAAFVVASRRDPAEVVAKLPPSWAEATVEKIAVNAVMAGCRPEYAPAVLAAVEAAAEEPFNLYGVQTTTHPCGVLVIVSGEHARQLGMNGAASAYGPGNRANATIGRALRLVLFNLGEARPPVTDRATQGSPVKFTFCIAENEAESPWPPLRVRMGFAATDSVVIVMAGEAPHNINDHGSTTAADLLTTIAGALGAGGKNTLSQKGDIYLVLGPEHAAQLAAESYGPPEIQRFVYEHARLPRGWLGAGQAKYVDGFLSEEERAGVTESYPIVKAPEDVNVLVSGGPGRHSSWIPTFGSTRSCAKVIR